VRRTYASAGNALGSLRARFRRPRGHGVVLCYHRLAEPSFDPWSLCVTPRNFEQQLECVVRFGEPVPLSELSPGLAPRRRARPRIAITFDDGYADNVVEGGPLFERFGIPVTIFLASGFVDSGRELWWDELERAVIEPKRLPDSLELDVAGTTYRRALVSGDAGARAELYEDLYWLIRPLEPAVRFDVLADLLAWAGGDTKVRSTHRLLSRDEVRRASATGHVTFGAHTRFHPVLALLDGDAQQVEVAGSKADVEDMTGEPAVAFAYPHGRAADYTAETVGIVRRAGFAQAFTTNPDPVTPSAEPFELPRVCVENLDRAAFRRVLGEWLR
jgi:peptidoglycan/xylan/chitin deacetylase (PgdA/CDA1 family)